MTTWPRAGRSGRRRRGHRRPLQPRGRHEQRRVPAGGKRAAADNVATLSGAATEGSGADSRGTRRALCGDSRRLSENVGTARAGRDARGPDLPPVYSHSRQPCGPACERLRLGDDGRAGAARASVTACTGCDSAVHRLEALARGEGLGAGDVPAPRPKAARGVSSRGLPLSEAGRRGAAPAGHRRRVQAP